MEDKKIIDLFFARSELALEAVKQKYGGLCYTIALNLLSLPEDAEECVNDTYHALWNTIPPQNPSSLGAYLGRLARNIAISRHRKNTAAKRDDGITLMLSELSGCIPSGIGTEQTAEANHLTELIGIWLNSLDREDRVLFVRRYWYGYSLKEIADKTASSAVYLATRMHKLRASLKEFLEKEGVTV